MASFRSASLHICHWLLTECFIYCLQGWYVLVSYIGYVLGKCCQRIHSSNLATAVGIPGSIFETWHHRLSDAVGKELLASIHKKSFAKSSRQRQHQTLMRSICRKNTSRSNQLVTATRSVLQCHTMSELFPKK